MFKKKDRTKVGEPPSDPKYRLYFLGIDEFAVVYPRKDTDVGDKLRQIVLVKGPPQSFNVNRLVAYKVQYCENLLTIPEK